MIQILINIGAFCALFVLFTLRLRAAQARTAFWKKVALGSAGLAAFAFIRKGGDA